ncbi:hypothetical protein SAMN04488137_2971 [Fictibacillus solisalsi]|uniref:Uncharacterized protein n=1 Tax=Fictibacillus solisalsi TaxID=459525 RepID=A0A1G9XRR1_9BACL|nr:hypothetical protein [Fictibacillus solisalsi]SDM99512.1 hypothetical protein SAMN04488137_2971 [Fictibacillus solisalsi]
MLNEYAVYLLAKARQEKVERQAQVAWMHQNQKEDNKAKERVVSKSSLTLDPCCSCAS